MKDNKEKCKALHLESNIPGYQHVLGAPSWKGAWEKSLGDPGGYSIICC